MGTEAAVGGRGEGSAAAVLRGGSVARTQLRGSCCCLRCWLHSGIPAAPSPQGHLLKCKTPGQGPLLCWVCSPARGVAAEEWREGRPERVFW